ncbi:DUF3990 domain-containing protein [Bifidobacterium saguinibicoloris]|uniref:DUF3990 domain-containing protein n=1 Tax=Bifidobacterium saguinibicoloris TaxID=2834433 RepID=UPI001C581E1C|nr:DUF3990 domain-containing protein [Bifidobacterium saguinibicoloris]MBW3080715.1 DUF3990 domain-containing protein [Bifidobacterium saguinibicoloris]
MRLYHGSNVEVRHPRLLRSDRRLDFGPGFYLTSSLEQASRWAVLSAKRRRTGSPFVTVYEFDEHLLDEFDTLGFTDATADWLDYIAANRSGDPLNDDYDVVLGPVADDATMPTLNGFFAGIYTTEETLERLMPQNLKDQYAFRTQRTIDALTCIEVIRP